MRKALAIILTLALLATLAAIPVFAAPGNQNFGNAKKISDSDVDMSNGERDAIWDYALAIAVDNTDTGGGEITGTAWLLWSDTAYYIYVEVNDPTPVSVDMSDWTDGEYFDAWVSDSVEVFIEVAGDRGDATPQPGGNYGEACWQFRIDRDGIPSSYQRDGAWTDDFMCGPSVNKDRYEWAAKQDGNKYYTKFKITYLGAPKPGELGIQIQINDLQEEFGGAPQTRSSDSAGSWDADQFGYAVLIDEPAYVAPPPAVEEEAPAAVGGGDSAPEPPPIPVPGPAAAPQTGDAGMIALVALLAIAAACVVVFRKKSVK